MIEFSTAVSDSAKCPVVCLLADKSQTMGQTVVSEIESQIESGSVFREGDSFQIGWSINRFKKRDHGLLLQEPDMKTLPVEFVDGSVQSLRHLKLQNQMVASCGLASLKSFAAMNEIALVGKDISDSKTRKGVRYRFGKLEHLYPFPSVTVSAPYWPSTRLA